jgi:diacyltrehalose acyltransferase
VHPDPNYDSINYDPLLPGEPQETDTILVTEIDPDPEAGTGRVTYVFVRTEQLPLLGPFREVGSATGTTFLTEPVLGGLEPVLRLLVDMGYTDRENLNPHEPTTFSLITPPDRIIETVVAMPGAITEGVTIFLVGVTAIPDSIPAPLDTTSAPAISASESEGQDLVVNRTAAAIEDTSPPTPSTDETTQPIKPPASELEDEGPTLGNVTEDGNKFTPNSPGGTTSNTRGNLFTQVNGAITGLLGGNKTSPAPTSDPAPSDAPSSTDSTSQDQEAAA